MWLSGLRRDYNRNMYKPYTVYALVILPKYSFVLTGNIMYSIGHEKI